MLENDTKTTVKNFWSNSMYSDDLFQICFKSLKNFNKKIAAAVFLKNVVQKIMLRESHLKILICFYL